ncbi:MAG: pyridoxamine 5'-phosphate oxidase family protein [Candidatus Thorarchaeota archaeon]
MKAYPETLGYSEVWPFFEKGGLAHVATIDGDQPRVRTMALITHDHTLWLVTHTSDNKVEQIKSNPKIEFTYTVPGIDRTGCLRTTATAEIIGDSDMRDAVAKSIRWFDGYWESGADPEYTLIRLTPTKMLFDHHKSRMKYTILL